MLHRFLLFPVALLVLLIATGSAATPYDRWAEFYGLRGPNAEPTENPDGDQFPNALEYVMGTDPIISEVDYSMAPRLVADDEGLRFVFQISAQSDGIAVYRVIMSSDLVGWEDAPGDVYGIGADGSRHTYALDVPDDGRTRFYRLHVTVPYGSTAGEPTVSGEESVLGAASSSLAVEVTIGTNVGSAWEGLPPIPTVVMRTEPPAVGGNGTDPSAPDLSKYPQVAGTSQVSFTKGLVAEYATNGRRLPRRSWMGFFLWGNGTPPPGLNPGYPLTGTFDASKGWDYFGFFYEKNKEPSTGSWLPIRMDQQPLYLMPLTINYSWPPGQFGYVTKPLQFFPTNFVYWKDKQIVRGINVSQSTAFFYQYSDYYNQADRPVYWAESWLFSATRPIESTVIVPGNLKPNELLENGPWNDIGASNPQGLGRYQPFPYPVWDTTLPAKHQTPFNIQVDRVGDFDSDLVWEGTTPGAPGYEKNAYARTAFNQPGKGNYLKMTVARGSPFTWCETNNNRYVTFYNLIRQNLANSIDNNTGTNARTIAGGPWTVDGVQGVSFILLYGDVNNPNQYYHEAEPPFFDPVSGQPGGFNPPGKQNNHVYTAVFYRTASVKTVRLGNGGPGSTANNGTDAQGNPYFYLEFNNPGKNWFVTGSIPVMRYYAEGVTPDPEAARIQAARDWAQQLGKYAFNFPTSSKISYEVRNMYQSDTTHSLTLTNPFVAAGVSGAASMTVNPSQTVLGLMPHHYQPLTLGPDLTKAGRTPVVWSPLRQYDKDFPVPSSAPPSANKNTASTPGRWGYWSPRGNLKPIITGKFTTSYPFQNFLPIMPPPKWERKFPTNSVLSVNVTNVGTGNVNVTTPPNVTLVPQPLAGTGATFSTEIDTEGRVNKVNVLTPGSGYANGSPSASVFASFPTPPSGKPAKADVFVVDGKVTQLLIADGGEGYAAPPALTLTSPPIGTGAELIALLEPNTGRIQQINVKTGKGGTGYPVGLPSAMIVQVDPPTSPTVANGGRQATAIAQVGAGGTILAVFMLDKGFGYSPTITVEQQGITTSPIIVPKFDPSGNLLAGPATVILAGSGFDYSKPYQVKVNSTGTGAEASIVQPGTVTNFLPQYFQGGVYPSSGNATEDAARVKVTLPPLPGGSTQQTARVTGVVPLSSVQVVIEDSGDYSGTTAPTASFQDDTGATFEVALNFGGGKVIAAGGVTPANPKVTAPRTLVFSGGTFTRPAAGRVYGTFAVDSSKVELVAPIVTGYSGTLQATFSGGEIETDTHKMPEIRFDFTAEGALDPAKLHIVNGGSGWTNPGQFRIDGGRGYDAVLRAFVSDAGGIIGVNVIDPGSGYPSEVYATAPGGSTPATFSVRVDHGKIAEVKVLTPGTGYSSPPSLQLFSVPNGTDPIGQNPKGPFATVAYSVSNGAVSGLTMLTAGENYFPGTATAPSSQSPQALLTFTSPPPPVAAPVNQASRLLANVLPASTDVQQGLYDAMISYYTNSFASKNLAPFGGAFEGTSAPDGYGLGNQLQAAARFTSDIFNFQQFVTSQPGSPDQPAFAPSTFAQNDANQLTSSYAAPILQQHSPAFTLTGALKTSVQSLQRTVTRLFDANIAGNNPDSGKWKLNYFNLYDENAGRVVVNPTASNPASGITSSVQNPPTPDLSGSGWSPGYLWSGFGVSDQWNDQHYFYGYYLSTAAMAGILDRSWETNINGKPADLWAGPNQMGAAIDQWMMTLAYDPDNAALTQALYKLPDLTFQKFAFFDQWAGHGWATGVPPAPSYGVINDSDIGNWFARGTRGAQYNQENENSIYEGMQAWSATVLWGGATDRKAVVDLGIYLMATEMAAADLYFLDKNLNLGVEGNEFSWAPVTTVDSSAVKNNGGNNNLPKGTDYVTSAQEAFYKPYPSFGRAAGTGNSLMKKTDNSIDTFFLGYPAGPKLIQAFPPTPWTLGISRNNDYMRRWAGAFMRQEWADIRDGGGRFYSPADWIAMAMTSALSGVPYNPGDQPFPPTGISTTPSLPPYVERLWAQWVTPFSPAGIQAPMKPQFNQTTVLSFLLAIEDYGTPDWTYIAKVTDQNGVEKNDSIVFSAVFSKVVGSNVETTFVLFNPGWETRHAQFFRLAANGTPSSTPVATTPAVLNVEPKRMATLKMSIPIQ